VESRLFIELTLVILGSAVFVLQKPGDSLGNPSLDFFSAKTEATKRIATLLHIARQAGAPHVAFDLGLVGLCTVFEGVVDALFKEARLNETLIEESTELQAFKKAREEVLDQIAAQGDLDAGYKRLQSVIQAAEVVRKREKVIAIAKHLGLDWESTLKPAFHAWDTERHPGAHGAYNQESDEAVIAERMFSKSRIAGGINLLVAKRIGYKGLAIRSMLEDDFVTLG
jgi:hypothetical protein